MTRIFVRGWIVLFVILAVTVSFSLSTPSQQSAIATPESSFFGESIDQLIGTHRPSSVPAVTNRVSVTITTTNRSPLFNRTPRGGTPLGTFRLHDVVRSDNRWLVHGTIPMNSIRRLLRATNATAIEIDSAGLSGNTYRAAGVSEIGAIQVHERSISGDNVTVGIIDSGFLPSHPAIAGQVGGYARFGRTSSAEHGTAVASVVVDTAPNATLLIAAIGNTTTPTEYRRAMDWFDRSAVDIVIDAGSYYSEPTDGSSAIDRIVRNVSYDRLVVTSVGNHNHRYWSGTHRNSTWVEFANGTEVNPLAHGQQFSGPVTLTVRWNQSAPDYDLYLYRRQPGTDAVVAQATGERNRSVEYLSTTVPYGQYYVSVEQSTPLASGTQPVELSLYATRELQYQSDPSPVSPATVESVLAVGSYSDGTIPDYSVSSPDLVAPESTAVTGLSVVGGTSFGAPYVGGVGALVLSADPTMSPEALRERLRTTAVDVGPPGHDPRAGGGLVDAPAAVGIDCPRSSHGLPCLPVASSLVRETHGHGVAKGLGYDSA